MTRQCEARTAKGTRCRREGSAYKTVQYTDGVREFLVCRRHTEAIFQRSFRPAVHREPIKPESRLESTHD